jgi:hypothetical protein
MSNDELDVERLTCCESSSFARRTIELSPASVLDDDGQVDWDQAIVFVTAGEIELTCRSGARARFRRGDILSFAPFPNRVVRTYGGEPARLLAIWRRASPSESTG